MEYLIIFVTLLITLKFLEKLINKRKRNKYKVPQTNDLEPNKEKIEPNNVDLKYQAKLLLTKNEWYEWKKLNHYASEKGYIICPKVRLLDIIEPIKSASNYMSLLGKIQAKHVDFVICDKNLHIKGIIELDDNSHNASNRKERDEFVDQILTQVGYKIIHTKSITEETLSFIESTADGQNGQ